MSLATLLQSIEQFADECSNAYDEDPAGVPESAAVVLAALRDCRADLAMLAKKVARDLIAMAGSKRFTVPVLGEVEIKKATKRTGWRHDELLPAIISRVMDEPATIYDEESGELLPYATIGHNVARRIRECVSLGGGKVTGLRAMGLDESEFCHVEPDGYSVVLPPRSS